MKLSPVPAPLIVHVVYRFQVGGLENGVVNLINRLPPQGMAACRPVADRDRCRLSWRGSHARTSATSRLYKGAGSLLSAVPNLFRLFRELRPAIVHTRNIAALEASVPAWAAAVPARVHGEHGRDVDDLDGSGTGTNGCGARSAPS